MLVGNLKPSGITPMIVGGKPLTRTARPMHRRVAARSGLPDAVADDARRGGAPGWSSSGTEVAAEDRLLADHVEDVGRDVDARRTVRHVPASLTLSVVCARARGRRRVRAGAPVLEVGARRARSGRCASRGRRARMMRSGSSKGRPRIRTALTSVNTVALTPMPSASAIAAAS